MQVFHKAMLPIIAMLSLFPVAAAFYASPIFSGFNGNCTQLNSTFVSCDDASPVPVSFSVSAMYSQYYGNFSVYSTNTNNVSEPLGLNGKLCTVPSSSTVTCVLTLLPIPITSGTGTMNKTFTIMLVSNNYPQISFEDSFNITIAHALTSFESSLLRSYNSSYTGFVSMRMKYLYLCDTYGICSEGIEANLTAMNGTFRNVSALMGGSELDEAYSNLTAANYSMLRMEKPFSAFLNTSNMIVNNILKAKATLAGLQAVYAQNKAMLSKCTFPNGTSYSNEVNSTIARLGSAENIATLGSSYSYLNETIAAKDNETVLVRACAPLAPVAGIGLNLPNKYVFYGVIAIVILLAIYSAHKFLDFRSAKAIRSAEGPAQQTGLGEAGAKGKEAEVPMAEDADEEKAGFETTAKKESAQEEKTASSSLEDEFDSWLNDIMDKQQHGKLSEAKTESPQ